MYHHFDRDFEMDCIYDLCCHMGLTAYEAEIHHTEVLSRSFITSMLLMLLVAIIFNNFARGAAINKCFMFLGRGLLIDTADRISRSAVSTAYPQKFNLLSATLSLLTLSSILFSFIAYALSDQRRTNQ